jgi:RNA polymerase sigma factor (sigma-70 family)
MDSNSSSQQIAPHIAGDARQGSKSGQLLTSHHHFPDTRWTQVHSISTGADNAFHELSQWCRTYWQPLYCYARRCGQAPEAAQDLTQEFFLNIIERNLLDRAEPGRGHLRSFLLTAFKNHIWQSHRKASRQKRGGNQDHVSFEQSEDTNWIGLVPANLAAPDEVYHRQWALDLLHTALRKLELEWTLRGKAHIYTALQPHLTGEETNELQATAEALNTPFNTVRSWLHRLRLAYHATLWQTVSDTLDDKSPAAITAELQELRNALATTA